MSRKAMSLFFSCLLRRGNSRRRYGCFNPASYHRSEELDDEGLFQSEWYRAAYAKLIRLAHLLGNVEHVDGRFTHANSSSLVADDLVVNQMKLFNSLARSFISFPSMQHALQKNSSSICFGQPRERNSMTLDSLTKVCNFLGVSAQQRKTIRLTVCPQVTQHHIWRGALEEVLKNLRAEMDAFVCDIQSSPMAEQIVSTCLMFLADTAELSDAETPVWMRPAPIKKIDKPLPQRKWEEVLEMFVDLSKCLAEEERLASHMSKLEAMREGLSQIKDILVERNITYKEARLQDCLVQRKLSKNLGHSSKCLFTLLMYYLHGSVRDIEVDLFGGLHGSGGALCLNIGKILTSCDEGMVLSGVKQLSRALGVFKFVWEAAKMRGVLELHGHLLCVGAEERSITYRGNLFYVHDIKM